MAEFTREQRVALEPAVPRLSEKINQEFLEALAQEKAGYHDNQ